MLHAELHGKVSSDADDAERREDVLTSTVFGTLLAASAWDVLGEWLARARRGVTAAAAIEIRGDDTDYWFWPWLDGAEPDVVLRLGRTVVIVEAKYNSGKSDGTAHELTPETITDQLVREWRACCPSADTLPYDRSLREAIHHPEARLVLVYLVRRVRLAREHAALDASMALEPGAHMFALTWEDLDAVLARRPHVRWARELQRYLNRRGVAAFRGFEGLLSPTSNRALRSWATRFAPRGGWASAISTAAMPRLSQLSHHRRRFPEP